MLSVVIREFVGCFPTHGVSYSCFNPRAIDCEKIWLGQLSVFVSISDVVSEVEVQLETCIRKECVV